MKEYDEEKKKIFDDTDAWKPGIISGIFPGSDGEFSYDVKDEECDQLPWKSLVPVDGIMLFATTSFAQLLLFGIAVPVVAFIVGLGQPVLLHIYILNTYKLSEFVRLTQA